MATAVCHASAARVYIRSLWVFARLHRYGRAAQRAMASIRPNGVAGARAPRAVGAALAIDGRLVPGHPCGGVGGAARRDAPVAVGADDILLGSVVVEGACAGGPSTAAASWRRDHGARAELQTVRSPIRGVSKVQRETQGVWQGRQREGVAVTNSCKVVVRDGDSTPDGVRMLALSRAYQWQVRHLHPVQHPLGSEQHSTMSCARPRPHTCASLCPFRLTGSSRALMRGVFLSICNHQYRAAHV